jgi:excisionase family DNA binding protein
MQIQLEPSVKPTLSVDEAAAVLGIGRASAYEGVRRGEIPSIRIGRLLRVPTAALVRMLTSGNAPTSLPPPAEPTEV